MVCQLGTSVALSGGGGAHTLGAQLGTTCCTCSQGGASSSTSSGGGTGSSGAGGFSSTSSGGGGVGGGSGSSSAGGDALLVPVLEAAGPLVVTLREAGGRFALRVRGRGAGATPPEIHCRRGGRHVPFSEDWAQPRTGGGGGGGGGLEVEVWAAQAAREPGLYEFEAASGEGGVCGGWGGEGGAGAV